MPKATASLTLLHTGSMSTAVAGSANEPRSRDRATKAVGIARWRIVEVAGGVFLAVTGALFAGSNLRASRGSTTVLDALVGSELLTAFQSESAKKESAPSKLPGVASQPQALANNPFGVSEARRSSSRIPTGFQCPAGVCAERYPGRSFPGLASQPQALANNPFGVSEARRSNSRIPTGFLCPGSLGWIW